MTVNTPCIGRCTTVYGDKICRGCRRYAPEIIAWNRYTDTEKRWVLQRLNQHTEQLLSQVFVIQSSFHLCSALDRLGVKYDRAQPVLTWVMAWLNSGYANLSHLERLGLQISLAYESLSLAELKETLEVKLFALAKGHYERYVEVQNQVVQQQD